MNVRIISLYYSYSYDCNVRIVICLSPPSSSYGFLGDSFTHNESHDAVGEVILPQNDKNVASC